MTEERTPPSPEPEDRSDVTRRSFLKGAGLSIAAAGVAGPAVGIPEAAAAQAGETAVVGPGKATVELTLNGKPTTWQIEPWQTLLDTLRDHAGLTGAKRVCDRGSCSGCTVNVDGMTVNSCTMLAIDVAGKTLGTIEGLAPDGQLTPLQESFIECDALQCGFCTPGMVMACTSVLEKNPDATRAEVAEGISGNICRCGTYQNIFEAVERTQAKAKGQKSKGGQRARF